MNAPTFAVYAQDFAGSAESRYPLGEYPTENDARTAAITRVRRDLKRLHQPGQNARQLFDTWQEQGEDVIIVPDHPQFPFSAIDSSRLMVLQITGDTSRPLLLEVTCMDCLNIASGFTTPPRQWTFWVCAPATYAGAGSLIRRATEFLYQEMSRIALAGDGSCYILLHVASRETTLQEIGQSLLLQPQKNLYTIREDGAFVE